MVRIFLTGYMGAGKTTLGKAFARKMNVPFVDLDWYIEERFHKTVGELFTERWMFIPMCCSDGCVSPSNSVPYFREKRMMN